MIVKTLNFVLSTATIAALALASVTTFGAATPSPAAGFNADQKTQIEQIIHDYLVNKPEVLIEASKSLQQKQMADVSSKAKDAITKNAAALFNSALAPRIGNADGDVTVVEFLDYQCGHCKTMSPVIAELVKADPKVKVVVRGLPIFGDASKSATKAVIAATKQGADKSIKLNDALLTTTEPLNEKSILNWAKKSGLDVNKLKKDMASKEVEDQITENFRLARELGLMGTPAFVLGNRNYSKTEFIPGATSKDDLTVLIAKLRS
jgi:protein-disulfide isomerase